jgi:hypothetical protein
MTLWIPAEAPADPAWWAPLEAVALECATESNLPLVLPCDFRLSFGVVRAPRATIHAYRDDESGRWLFIDRDGCTYGWRSARAGEPPGRYLRVVDTALGVAGVAGRERRGDGSRSASDHCAFCCELAALRS